MRRIYQAPDGQKWLLARSARHGGHVLSPLHASGRTGAPIIKWGNARDARDDVRHLADAFGWMETTNVVETGANGA